MDSDTTPKRRLGWPLRVISAVGRVLIASGLLLLAFVAYQLWGTNLHEKQAQQQLRAEFDAIVHSPATLPGESTTVAGSATTTTVAPGPTSTVAPVLAPTENLTPEIGGVVGEIEIPKIHVKKIVIQGAELEQLDQAPGHFPSTPFPGQAGNSAIAGHRTTYGAPFHNVDRLKPGDEIHVTTRQGRFTYSVLRVFIVKPTDVGAVVDPDPDHPNTLTLMSCHPKYDLSERIVVRAELKGTPVPKLPGQDAVQHKQTRSTGGTVEKAFSGARSSHSWFDTIGWGIGCALIALAAWLLARRRGRRWVIYPLATPVFCLALYFFFENVSLLLPAGF